MTSRKSPTNNEIRDWLYNSKQSTIQMARVRELVKQMKDGLWDIDTIPNDPIQIKDNAVEDGHHRLLAKLIYNQSVEMKVQESWSKNK